MFRQANNDCKKVLEAVKLGYANNTKEYFPRNLALRTLGCWIADIFLNKVKSAISRVFNDPEMLPSASDKAKFLLTNFSKDSNIDNSGIFWSIFPCRTNLKLHNISVIHKAFKKSLLTFICQKHLVMILFHCVVS